MQFAFTLACYFSYWSSYFAYHHWGKRQVTGLVTNPRHLNLRRQSKKSPWTLDYWQFMPLQSFAYILLWYFEGYMGATFKCGLLYYVWRFFFVICHSTAEHSLYILSGSHVNRICAVNFLAQAFCFTSLWKLLVTISGCTWFNRKGCSKLASGNMLWTTTYQSEHVWICRSTTLNTIEKNVI